MVPKYSIVIPTYNHLDDCLKPCLESIIKNTDLSNAEIIVVANGCKDNTKEYVESLGKPFKLIWMENQEGYIKPTNIGIKASQGEYVVLLNNDTIILDSSWLEILEKPFEDRKTGITGPYKDIRFNWDNDRIIFRESYIVFYCAMIKREVFDSIGLLDENFGYGYEEDLDFCIRASKAGYSLVRVPEDIHYDLNITKERILENPNVNTKFPVYHKDRITFKEVQFARTREQQSLLWSKHKINPKYSIIIPTYNHLDDCLKPCLESIIKNTNLDNVEVIVVANGCVDGTAEYVRSLGRPFFLYEEKEAMGYTKATNAGIRSARGDYIVLLNNDNVILDSAKNEWLDILQKPFLERKFVGITGAAKDIHPGTESEFLLFFCVMIDRHMIERIGLLDEIFNPGYGEDIDYCNKIRSIGYGVVQVPNDVSLTKVREMHEHGILFPIWHKGGATVSSFPGWDKVVPKNEDILLKRYPLANRKYDIKLNIDSSIYMPGYLVPKHSFALDFKPNTVSEIHAHSILDTVDFEVINQIIDGWTSFLKHDGKLYANLNPRTKVTLVKPAYCNGLFKGRNGFRSTIVDNRITGRSKEDIKNFVLEAGTNSVWGFGGKKEGGYCMLQNPDEIASFIYDFKDLDVENYLEIGVADHGVMRLFCDFNNVKNVYSIDLGWQDPSHPNTCRDNIDNLKNTGQYNLFRGDSHAPVAEEWLSQFGKVFDFIFIDGDHTYNGVLQDTLLAMKFAKEGCVFAYHDHACVDDVKKIVEEMKDSKIVGMSFVGEYISNDTTKKGIAVFRYSKKPKYSIVIPTYNHLDDCLKPCLESIKSHTDLSDVEVIVVANGCKDKTREYVESLGKPFKLIWIEEQSGYIKATNAGIKASAGDYIVLLNNDTKVLDKSWLPVLLSPFVDPSVGISGPRKAWRDDIKKEYILFFCAMIKREVIQKIGLLDEDFGIGYHEDTDFCIRATNAGYKLVEVPNDVSYSDSNKGDHNREGYFPIHHDGGATFRPIFGDRENRLTDSAHILYRKHNKPMVYDCFMFFNELDVLEIRLNELNSVVDRFVLVEAKYSHQGNPKPLYFEQNKDRFKKFLHKIEHVIVEEFPETNDSWVREPYQRNCAMRGLKNCKSDDIIILSDVDEIPKASVIQQYKKEMGLTCIQTKLFYYKLNYFTPVKWYKVRIFPYSEINGGDLQQFRGKKDYEYKNIIEDGGWHFSFIGDKEHIKQKIESWGHVEYNNDQVKNEENLIKCLNEGKDIFGRDIQFSIVPINEDFPKFVRDNLSYYEEKGLVAIDKNKTIQDILKEAKPGIFQEVYEIDAYGLLKEDVQNKIVVDIGANYGFFSFRCLEMGAKKSYCFEPQIDNFNKLLDLRKQIAIFDISAFNLAVLNDSTKEVSISAEEYCSNIWAAKNSKAVKCISLEEAVSYVQEKDKDMILKIDCEGSEFEIIFDSPPHVVQQFSLLYIEIHDNINPKYIGKSKELISYIESLGFIREKDGPQPGWWSYDGRFIPHPIVCIRFRNSGQRRNKITIGHISHNEEMFKKYLEPSINQLDPKEYNLISTTSENCIAKNYNTIISQSQDQYILLVHEDVGFGKDFLDKIRESIRVHPDFGVLGIVGFDSLNNTIWSNASSMQEVERLDPCCIVINKNNGIRFDDLTFDNFHMYVEDYCMQCKQKGIKCYTILYDSGRSISSAWNENEEFDKTQNKFFHYGCTYRKSGNTMWGKYDEYNRKFQDKWKAKNPKYSIIIPTYNHLDDCLKPCLESVIKNTDLSNVEVIVVANGCKDKTREYVESLGKPFRLVWMEDAAGYTKATNAGILEAKGEYVVLLNNDTYLLDYQQRNDWLNTLEQPFLNYAKTGISGPLKGWCPFVDSDNLPGNEFMIFFCAMIRRSLFDEIGLLDEDFTPGAGEDTDFCWRAAKAGYALVQVPYDYNVHTETRYAKGMFPIFHHSGMTRGDDFDRVKINNVKLIKKWKTKNLRINLTNDNEVWPGFFSADMENPKTTMMLDARKIDLDNSSVTEIRAKNLLGRFVDKEVERVISECARVLIEEGKITIFANDGEKDFLVSCLSRNGFSNIEASYEKGKTVIRAISRTKKNKELSSKFIDYCVSRSSSNISSIDREILSIEGMSSESIRHLFNNLSSIDGARYLEVGSWKGSTACSVLSNNKLEECVLIDNFSEFIPNGDSEAHKKDLIDNLSKFNSGNKYKFIEKDFFSLDMSSIRDMNIFFYDGSHIEKDHETSLQKALPSLADTFVFIVDDYEWPGVRKSTERAINNLIDSGKIQKVHEVVLNSDPAPKEYWPSGWQDGFTNFTSQWRNGLYVGLFKKTKAKIYDCFSFFNELDILEIRLNELDPYVDYFVLSEMTVTHSGNPKPLYFEQNKSRFEKFLHKIIHVIVDNCPATTDPWVREHFQRDSIANALQKCQDNDIIIISDLDEIPRGSKIQEYYGQQDFMYFEMHQYNYYLNMSVGVSPAGPGVYSRITTYKNLKNKWSKLTALRYRDCSSANRIADGGWHFSWMGGGDKIVEKLESWAHQELNIPDYKNVQEIERNIDKSVEALGRSNAPHKPILVAIDNSFPKYILDNQECFLQNKMIKSMPVSNKVGIVMPYYNDKKLLIRSVFGILNQTYRDWVLFLVDDGSLDENKASAIFGNSIPDRIRIIDKKNGGVSSARNMALEEIRKDPSIAYVAYCDSDDIWGEGYLESQISNIKDCDFVYSEVRHEFENGEKAIPYGITNPKEYPGLEYMLSSAFIFISSVVHRRECLTVGEFDSNLDSIEDWDMWVRIAKAGYRIKKNDSASIIYTVKSSSNMASRRTPEIYEIFKRKHENSKQ